MSRELELFKRWFGWDPAFIFKDPPFTKGCFIKILPHVYETDDYQVGVYKFFKALSSNKLKKIMRNLHSVRGVTREYGDENYTLLVYSVPKKYHSEWEQYVKEMK